MKTARRVAKRRALHIVQGGIDNGDKRWLERAAARGLTTDRWVVPKSALVGDEVVVYVRGYGLFATAMISSPPRPRQDWPNRYGAGLRSVRRIDPPISLGVLGRSVPGLQWTKYPRSITTPESGIADAIRQLVDERRKHRGAEVDEQLLDEAGLDELRALALAKASPRATAHRRQVTTRTRASAIKFYAVARANGRCEFCGHAAPFLKEDGKPYLESHHILRVADEGPDHPQNVIGVCPNCHRRAHHAKDKERIKTQMRKRVVRLERQRNGRL